MGIVVAVTTRFPPVMMRAIICPRLIEMTNTATGSSERIAAGLGRNIICSLKTRVGRYRNYLLRKPRETRVHSRRLGQAHQFPVVLVVLCDRTGWEIGHP